MEAESQQLEERFEELKAEIAELTQKKLEIDTQNVFILQIKQENETLRTEL